MCRPVAVLALTLITGGCVRAPEPPMDGVAFLTREGCVNTEVMRARLIEALAGLGLSLDYTLVDLDTLPDTDQRTGYPTPTVLYHGRDVFGLPDPQPPYSQPG